VSTVDFANIKSRKKNLSEKAFDSVNHNILISKLEYASVRGKALNIFSYFWLEDIKLLEWITIQVTFYQLTMESHDSRGTMLGTLFFIIYANGLFCLNLNAKIISFADDTLILVSGTSNNVVNILIYWLHALWKQLIPGLKITYSNLILKNLSLCVLKFIITRLIYNPLFKDYSNCNMTLDSCKCDKLEHVDSIKYLWVIFDRNLKCVTGDFYSLEIFTGGVKIIGSKYFLY